MRGLESKTVALKDRQILIEAGNYCYVLNSRQMGKSSLRVRTMQKLTEDSILCGFIDLTGIGTEDITPQKWYAGMVQMLVKSCQLDNQWRIWWRERRDILSPVQCFAQFIEEILLNHTSGKIVIFIDEIDSVLIKKIEKHKIIATLKRLSAMSYSYPISQYIAAESLKNSVNKQYLSLIKAYFPDV